MNDGLILENKKFISAKQAAALVGYTRDYVGQISREGKVEAKMVGRNWFISEDSILNHKILNIKKNIHPKIQALLINRNNKYLEDKKVDLIETKNNKIDSNLNVLEKKEEIIFDKKINSNFTANSILNRKEILRKNNSLFSTDDLPVSFKSSVYLFNAPTSFLVNSNIMFGTNFKRSKNLFNLNNYKDFVAVFIVALVFSLNIFFVKDSLVSGINSFTGSGVNSEFKSLALDSKKTLDTFFKNMDIGAGVVLSKAYSLFSNIKPVSKYEPREDVVDSTKLFDGVVVVPATSNVSDNNIIKDKIKNNFSDEVNINPDNSGISGVITPIFKKVDKDSYIYVLVPTVKEKLNEK